MLHDSVIKAYIMNTDGLDADKLYKEKGSYFSRERISRIENCKNPKSRANIIIAGAFTEAVLSRYGYTSGDIVLEENGKPCIKGSEDFFFNLSHSGNLCLMAVSDSDIGADIQKPVTYREALAARILTKEEFSEAQKERDRLSFYWSLKESYVKFTGQGISKDFKEISFKRISEAENGVNDVYSLFDNGSQAAFSTHIYSRNGFEGFVTCKALKSRVTTEIFTGL